MDYWTTEPEFSDPFGKSVLEDACRQSGCRSMNFRVMFRVMFRESSPEKHNYKSQRRGGL